MAIQRPGLGRLPALHQGALVDLVAAGLAIVSPDPDLRFCATGASGICLPDFQPIWLFARYFYRETYVQKSTYDFVQLHFYGDVGESRWRRARKGAGGG